MDRLFDDFSRTFDIAPSSATPLMSERSFWPRIEMSENDRELTLSAELPGLEEKDIDVQLTGNTLTIKGEKKMDTEERGRNYYRKERSYGAFERAVELPCEVDRERVQANFRKGVLSINLPKTPQAQRSTRKIQVKTG
jgi:HSP20 family protein